MFTRGKEGFGNPLEALTSVMEFLAVQGFPLHAIAIALCADGILIAHDRSGLKRCDVHDDGHRMIIEVGIRKRGEEVKTGVKQRVVIEREWVRQLLKGVDFRSRRR